MLTRLRSFKLTLLLAYALVLQGVALATTASARQASHGATSWCISAPPEAVAGATLPSAPVIHDDTCCMAGCASGAFAFPIRADAASKWSELLLQRPSLMRATARLRDNPAHPWSPRGPPSV